MSFQTWKEPQSWTSIDRNTFDAWWQYPFRVVGWATAWPVVHSCGASLAKDMAVFTCSVNGGEKRKAEETFCENQKSVINNSQQV